jgi:hypothetical protein
MALRDTINQMHQFLSTLGKDLAKASKGNKTAAQRVRTNSINLGKIAKKYRKESVAQEKKKPRNK